MLFVRDSEILIKGITDSSSQPDVVQNGNIFRWCKPLPLKMTLEFNWLPFVRNTKGHIQKIFHGYVEYTDWFSHSVGSLET